MTTIQIHRLLVAAIVAACGALQLPTSAAANSRRTEARHGLQPRSRNEEGNRMNWVRSVAIVGTSLLAWIAAAAPALGAHGARNTFFDGDGFRLTNISDRWAEYAKDVVVEPVTGNLGKPVVVGFAQVPSNPGDSRMFVLRYHANGTLDSTFAGDGLRLVDFPGFGSEEAHAVVRQPDGKYVIAGTVAGSGGRHFALARLLPSGTLDPRFDEDPARAAAGTGDGMVVTDFSSQFTEVAVDLVREGTSGDLIAAGYGADSVGQRPAMARYNPDGSLDPSFGSFGNGKQLVEVPAAQDEEITDLVPQAGRLVATIRTRAGGADDSAFRLARFFTDGTLDPTFGGAGTGFTATNFVDSFDRSFAAVVRSDGVIVAGGERELNTVERPTTFAQVFYRSDGVPIRAPLTDLASSHIESIQSYVADGTFVNAAGEFDGPGGGWAFARYDAAGQLVPTFDGDGVVIVRFSGGDARTELRGMAADAGGFMVAVGSTPTSGVPTVAVGSIHGLPDPKRPRAKLTVKRSALASAARQGVLRLVLRSNEPGEAEVAIFARRRLARATVEIRRSEQKVKLRIDANARDALGAAKRVLITARVEDFAGNLSRVRLRKKVD